jgi:hypothetical protein
MWKDTDTASYQVKHDDFDREFNFQPKDNAPEHYFFSESNPTYMLERTAPHSTDQEVLKLINFFHPTATKPVDIVKDQPLRESRENRPSRPSRSRSRSRQVKRGRVIPGETLQSFNARQKRSAEPEPVAKPAAKPAAKPTAKPAAKPAPEVIDLTADDVIDLTGDDVVDLTADDDNVVYVD